MNVRILRKGERRNLPIVLSIFKNYLKNQNIQFCKTSEDGRVNSSLDEDIIINYLISKYPERVYRPKVRMWYDIKVYDYRHGWIPVNIKTTTMSSPDNTANLAMATYAYTNFKMDLDTNYSNGEMSRLLLDKLSSNNLNTCGRDYYFLVLNKKNPTDIIINSTRGLSHLTSNTHNLPFQVNWRRNRKYVYKPVDISLKLFLNCLGKCNMGWRENFISNIQKIYT